MQLDRLQQTDYSGLGNLSMPEQPDSKQSSKVYSIHHETGGKSMFQSLLLARQTSETSQGGVNHHHRRQPSGGTTSNFRAGLHHRHQSSTTFLHRQASQMLKEVDEGLDTDGANEVVLVETMLPSKAARVALRSDSRPGILLTTTNNYDGVATQGTVQLETNPPQHHHH